MTVAELIAELQECPADAEVFVWADHGQNYEDVTGIEVHRDLCVRLQEEEVDGLAVALYGL